MKYTENHTCNAIYFDSKLGVSICNGSQPGEYLYPDDDDDLKIDLLASMVAEGYYPQIETINGTFAVLMVMLGAEHLIVPRSPTLGVEL